MARSEDGEFELILGNKQLLSVFFIVVVLLGVFFTMGYIVGKNSVSADMVAGKQMPVGAIVVDPAPVEGKAGDKVVIEPDKPSPVSGTKPTPEPAAKKVETAAKVESHPTPTPTPTPAPAPAATSGRQPALGQSGEPASGQTFLQVVASTRPDCEIIVDVLKRKGFPALVAPIPNNELFRVLVGPLTDAATISKTRTELEAAGFQKPYLRKY